MSNANSRLFAPVKLGNAQLEHRVVVSVSCDMLLAEQRCSHSSPYDDSLMPSLLTRTSTSLTRALRRDCSGSGRAPFTHYPSPSRSGRHDPLQMAPLTRFRAPNHVPVDRHATYYAQRASKGGLLITEATFISMEAGGLSRHVPGIWSQEQIQGWKKVTEAVHKKGGVIYLQQWAIGRANPGKEDVPKVVSASNVPFEGGATPEPLSVDDIKRYVESYRQAALNAIEAGFDGVEIHS